jgi:hypothetical protein
MKRHVIAFPAHPAPNSSTVAPYRPGWSLGPNEGADLCNTPPKKWLLGLAGTVILLLGCQQDPVGKAPGGLEPSASSQRSEDRDDTGVSGPDRDGSSGSGAQTGDSGEGPGSGDADSDDSGASGSGSGSGGGSAN